MSLPDLSVLSLGKEDEMPTDVDLFAARRKAIKKMNDEAAKLKKAAEKEAAKLAEKARKAAESAAKKAAKKAGLPIPGDGGGDGASKKKPVPPAPPSVSPVPPLPEKPPPLQVVRDQDWMDPDLPATPPRMEPPLPPPMQPMQPMNGRDGNNRNNRNNMLDEYDLEPDSPYVLPESWSPGKRDEFFETLKKLRAEKAARDGAAEAALEQQRRAATEEVDDQRDALRAQRLADRMADRERRWREQNGGRGGMLGNDEADRLQREFENM